MKRTTRAIWPAAWPSTLLLALGACGSEPSVPTAATQPVEQTRQATRSQTANGAPVIDSLQLEPARPRPGERVTARASVTDPDGDQVEIAYSWRIDGNSVADTGRTLHLEGASKGALIEVVVVASDKIEQSDPARATVRVGNLAPRVLQVVIEPLGEVTADHDITASPRANDPDGDSIEFEYFWRVNGEMIDTEEPTLSAEHYKRGDSIELEVVASDGIEESEPLRSAPFPVVNSPPLIVSVPGRLEDDGVFRYDVRVEDVDGDRSYVYRVLEGPEGLTVDPVDGRVTWIPGPDQEGTHPVELLVDDRNGGEARQSFELQISYTADESPPAAPQP